MISRGAQPAVANEIIDAFSEGSLFVFVRRTRINNQELCTSSRSNNSLCALPAGEWACVPENKCSWAETPFAGSVRDEPPELKGIA